MNNPSCVCGRERERVSECASPASKIPETLMNPPKLCFVNTQTVVCSFSFDFYQQHEYKLVLMNSIPSFVKKNTKTGASETWSWPETLPTFSAGCKTSYLRASMACRSASQSEGQTGRPRPPYRPRPRPPSTRATGVLSSPSSLVLAVSTARLTLLFAILLLTLFSVLPPRLTVIFAVLSAVSLPKHRPLPLLHSK